MSEFATARALEAGHHLTERDWQPTSSGAERHSSSIAAGPTLVDVSYSGTPTASLDLPRQKPEWWDPTLRTVQELLRLQPNWNSYRAAPVRPDMAVALVGLLIDVMGDHTPPPAVVPTASGGLQAEWHRAGYDLEIEVVSPSRFVAYFEDLEAGRSESVDVVSDLRLLVEWIELISR